ncbi:MAG: DNA mismatch repair endonuclease MutL [Bacilli bacterium]|nr:DNA mismatch repair endonuclease MutL [Bacilli bacterium]MBO6194898.1 DNA mismatch repair endonuclease MutL [Bacilli bacterium]
MGKIEIMNENLSNKIAAGEVVERCASVIKELIENSIDAGSTDIKIELKESGIKSMKVTDNGCGMDKEDALLCFSSHATSKLKTEEDLFNISTLGFRGEALPSIASVSYVILKTCDGKDGIIYELDGGKKVKEYPGDLRRGTSIEVKDLFYNTPARLKYLSSLYTELANITQVVNREALSHTNIRFTLINDDKEVLKTGGSGNLLKTINDIYGVKTAKKMLEVKCENDDYEVFGYISLPEITKSNRNHIITMVNGRVVRNSELNRVINDAYFKYKFENRYPVVVLQIKVDPTLTDVNIHPSKMDIKFSNFEDLKEMIFNAIKDTLNNHFLAPVVDNTTIKVDNVQERVEVKEYVLDFSDNDKIIKEEENNYNYQVTDIEEDKKDEKREFPDLEPVGQVCGTYIVCTSEKGMYLIDQHAAAERVNYEKYKKEMANPTHDTIDMLFPINLEYSKDEFIIIKEHIDFIKSLGIEIEEFGQSSFIVRSHPTWFKEGLEELFIRNVLEKIITMNKDFDLEKFNDSISAMMACKASIKANDPISIEESKSLIEQLKKCENPFNCAHGRPSIIHYPKYELDKLFKRAV